LADLVGKHLLDGGVLTMAQLSERVALSGSILDGILNFMRKEARIEVLAATAQSAGLRYGLTDRGRASALEALMRGGYVGPAPVPLAEYVRVVAAQTVHDRRVTRTAMTAAFADVVLRDGMLESWGREPGRAIHSGPAGTGKTYITQRTGSAVRCRFPTPSPSMKASSRCSIRVVASAPTASPAAKPDVRRRHDPRWCAHDR
jgi:hypothetical protein